MDKIVISIRPVIIENHLLSFPLLTILDMLDQLLSIYNFLPLNDSPSVKIDLRLVENYPPIQKILSNLCYEQQSDGESVDEMYFLLNEFITKEEQTLGPKRFKKLIENIFTVISQYVINLIRSPHDDSQSVFLHLTYYKKNCAKYIDNFYSSNILIFYIFLNFKMNQLLSVQQKILECRGLVKELIKDKQREKQANAFSRLCALFESQMEFKHNKLKKAKDSCSKIISLASLQLTESIRGKKNPSAMVKIQLLLCSLTVSQIYKGLGKSQLYTFILNKCIEYSEKFLEDNIQFLRFLKVDQLYPKYVKIRLTRLQEKIKRIELVEEEQAKKRQERANRNTVAINFITPQQSENKTIINLLAAPSNKFSNITNKLVFSKDKNLTKKSATFHYATLRSNPSQNIIEPEQKLTLKFSKHIGDKQMKKMQQQKQSELKNLLIIKDKKKNYYRLKEETLKYLKKENNQLIKIIRVKDKEINQINQVQETITKELDVKNLQQEIQKFKAYESSLISEIEANKWQNLNQLPAVKKINRYFKSFFQQKQYLYSKNVYSLVYGEMINMSQIKMISMLKRKINKQSKQAIFKVTYNKIKHQVEYIRQQKQNQESSFFLNIYQTQKGNGINEQIQISEDQYKVIKYEPFYNFYSVLQNRLISFEQHLKNLSLREAYFVNKFIRFMNRFNPTKGKVFYRKAHYRFNYHHGSYIQGQKKPQELHQTPSQHVIQAVFLLKLHYLPLSVNQNKKNDQKVLKLQQNREQKTEQGDVDLNQSSKQNKGSKMIEVTVEKISNTKYFNPIYNFYLCKKFTIPQTQFNQQSLLKSVLCEKMNSIFLNFKQHINTIQKNIRRKLSLKKINKIKPNFHVSTYAIKGTLFTLVINKQTNKNVFFIENIHMNQNTGQILQNIYYRTAGKKSFKKYQIFIKKDVTFSTLDFLSKIQNKLQEDENFEAKYNKIEKYLKIKNFGAKIFSKSKNIRFFTDFQTQFKRKLCFAIIKKDFLFRGKMRQGRIMYMLTVKQFSKIPRPYTLRIFTFDQNSDILINAQKTIYNKEKIFLESKLSTINEVVEIMSRHQFEIFGKGKAQAIKKVSSRISILSNYSFQSGESNKDHGDEKGHVGGIFNRRMSKNSMFAKFRHKALIKNQDMEAIKKLVEERNMNKDDESSSSSDSSRNSVVTVVTPVKSFSSREEESDSV